jgi:hypothetical protein
MHRLAELGVAASKVAAIIDAVREVPDILETGISRRGLERAYNHIFSKVAVSVELPMLGSTETFCWEFASFQKLIAYYCDECHMYRNAIAELHQRTPCNPEAPWSMVLYCDETSPGDPLRLDARKKYMAVYASIKDFGEIMLKHEAMWLPLATLRTNKIKILKGGWANAFRHLLRRLLLGEDNIRIGVPICSLGLVIYFKVSNMLADEDALKQVWSSMGANGTFPAVELQNVTALPPRGLIADTFVDLSCTDVSKFMYNTNEFVWEKVDVLRNLANDPTCTVANLGLLETGYGLHHNEEGILQDHELRPHFPPVDVTTHDPQHAFFCDGLCHTELNLIIASIQQHGISFDHIRACLASGHWQQPSALRKACSFADIFSPARERHYNRQHKLSAFASEMFGLILPFTHFLESTVGSAGVLIKELESFRRLAVVVRTVSIVKQGHAKEEALADALRGHGDAHIDAYGHDNIKPKFLYCRLIPRQRKRAKAWLDCFPCERKHALMKSAGRDVDNTRCYEKSVLSRALWLHKRQLDTLNLDGLNRGGVPCNELAQILGVPDCNVAKEFRVCGTLYAAGDIMVGHCGTICGKILVGFDCSGDLGVFWEPFCNPVSITSVATRWERSRRPVGFLVRGGAFRALALASAWAEEPGERALVIR